jgi:IgA Peptidase M64
MTTADGTVLGTTKIVDHGLPWQRWDLVIMGDGYRASELAKYHDDVAGFIAYFSRTRPFNELWNAINIYRVDVSSTDSGADDPVACGGSGATPATYFDATFCSNGELRNSLVVNRETAYQVANDSVPQWDVALVLVNSPIIGATARIGLGLAVSSTRGGGQPMTDQTVHEFGHAAFGLADEYPFDCFNVGPGRYDRYNGSEPVGYNISIHGASRSRIKWGYLIDPSTPLPTKSNPDCTECDTQPSPVPPGTVGAFEGAGHYHCGIYRPEFDCKMRYSSYPFCAVCERVIRITLTEYSRDDPVIVPEFVGLSAGDARRLCGCSGLRCHFRGCTTRMCEVQSQSPLGGSIVERGSAVSLTMVRLEEAPE